MKRSQWVISGTAAGLAGALSALTVQAYRSDMQAADQRLSLGRIAQTAAGPIEYASVGDGPPVLVVHGAGGGFDQGLYTSQAGGDDFRWFAVSRFGYLGTPMPSDASHEKQAAAHLALLDALGIQRAAVIGTSAGGPSSLLFALRYPERCSALVLVSAVSGPLPLQLGAVERFERILFRSDFFDWLLVRSSAPVLYSMLGVSPRIRARLTAAEKRWLAGFVRQIPPLQRRRLGLLWDRANLPQTGLYPLEEITAPTMVVHAADDPLVPQSHGRRTAQTIPGARLVMVENGGHLLMGRHQEAWGQVRTFLGQWSGAQPA